MDGSAIPPAAGWLARAHALVLPGHVVLTPYQTLGIARLLSGTAPIHAWAIGSGKTWLAVASFLLLRQNQPHIRMVVTLPKSIAGQWRAVLESCGIVVHVMRSAAGEIPAGVDVVLVPATATLVKGKDKLKAWLGAGFLVLDEAHLFKGMHARRTQAIYGVQLNRKGGLAEQAVRVLAMSGTFSPNNNGELYPHLRALAPETIAGTSGKPMSGTDFMARYCVMAPFGPARTLRPVRSANTEELRERIDPRITVVTTDQVQAAFPHPREEIVRLDPQDVDFDFLAAAARMPDLELREQAVAIHRRIMTGAGEAVVDAAVAELLTLAGQDRHLAHLRRAIGIAKVAWLEDFMTGRDHARPTLVFNSFTETGDTVAARLAEAGVSVVRIYGATPEREREAAIRTIRDCRVAVALLQIDAAGAGLNLQSADTVVMLEPSWSPGVNDQAIGRACRIGQDTSVRILWPVIRNTIDEAVMRVLRRKASNARKLWS